MSLNNVKHGNDGMSGNGGMSVNDVLQINHLMTLWIVPESEERALKLTQSYLNQQLR